MSGYKYLTTGYSEHQSACQLDRGYKLTVLSAPILELNRVAVTTRLLLGSTAPTAKSGVSITATNFGGAVSTAARPNRTGSIGVDGVPERDDGLMGVIGVRGTVLFSERRVFIRGVDVGTIRRCGVDTDDVERDNEEIVRVRLMPNDDGGDNCDTPISDAFPISSIF